MRKIEHIIRSEEFADIVASGKRIRGKTVSLYIKPRERTERLSIGVIISKDFARMAVKRNYIRRLIYAYFRDQSASLEKSNKIVVRLTRNIAGLGRKVLSEEIRQEIERIQRELRKIEGSI